MISVNDLKSFHIFESLKDENLEKLIPLAEPAEFSSRSVIFREGESAENVYLLASGKVLLEQRMTKHMIVTVDTLKPGDVFGISSIVGSESYTMDAMASEKSNVLVLNSHELSSLLAENPEMGYKILKRLCIAMKKQLTDRTDLFVRSISNHPDFADLHQ